MLKIQWDLPCQPCSLPPQVHADREEREGCRGIVCIEKNAEGRESGLREGKGRIISSGTFARLQDWRGILQTKQRNEYYPPAPRRGEGPLCVWS